VYYYLRASDVNIHYSFGGRSRIFLHPTVYEEKEEESSFAYERIERRKTESDPLLSHIILYIV